MRGPASGRSGASVGTSISVVLPNYNHAAYVGQALRGILNQRRPPDEVIVIDDASTDDSLAVIERAVAGRPEVRLIRHTENQGVIAALNEGLAAATGELVGFYAADDVLFPDFLAEQERLLLTYPQAAFGCTAAQLWDADGTPVGRRPALLPVLRPGYVPPARFARQLRWGDNFFLGVVAVMRREAMQAVGGFDPAIGPFADGVAMRRMAAHHGYVFHPRELGAWRTHGANYSRTSSQDAERTRHYAETAAARFRADAAPGTPNDYPERFVERALFAAAKLPVLAAGADRNELARAVAAFLGQGIYGQLARTLLPLAGPAARPLALALLFLRFRPYSPFMLAAEPVRKALARRLAAPPADRR